MPQRDTVAGDACVSSSTSKSVIMLGVRIGIVSPLLRQSFRVSSSTVFRAST